MSCYKISYANGRKIMSPVSTLEEYQALRDNKTNLSCLAAARLGNKLAKTRLLQINYSCYPGKNNQLKGSTFPTKTVGMDIDLDPKTEGYKEQMERLPSVIIEKMKDKGLLMLERSVNKGYHLVFKRIDGLSQVENLKHVSELLGVQFDEGAKDITRVFFTTSNQDLLYISQELFADNTPSPEEMERMKKESERLVEDFRDGIKAASKTEDESYKEPEGTLREKLMMVLPSACYEDKYNGHTIADIIENYFTLYNEAHIPQKGNRNVMTFELARSLRCIVDFSLAALKKYIPPFAGISEDEWEKTLINACNESRKGMDYKMRKVLQSLEEIQPIATDSRESLNAELPPAMPQKLPHSLEVLSSNVPDYYKPAVCEGVFPALATHLHGCKFVYWDNVQHEATFMNLLVAPMSTGKGCIRKPIQYILQNIVQRDRLSRIKECEWKLANKSAKKATPRPDDICIQVLIDNLTDAVFNQRVVDADRNGERYIYTQCDELDTLKQLTSRGTSEQVSILIRKAFDNSLHGQERVGVDSVTGIAPLRFNFNASTTIPNCRRFFTRGVNDGTITRLSMSTIIKPVDAPRPVFGEYGEGYFAEVNRIVDILGRQVGTFSNEEANEFVSELLDENETLSDVYGSEAYLVLSYRATVIAWLKGMMLSIMEQSEWTQEIKDYVRWSLRYDLWCKMKIFGQQLDTEIKEEKTSSTMTRSNNVLNMLPERFRLEDVANLVKPDGSKIKNPQQLIYKWKQRGYVNFNDYTDIITKNV